MHSFKAAIDRLSLWLGNIAAGLLILLVLLITYNVFMRYTLRASSLGLEELSWHIYGAVFLLAIPFALKTNSHVRVDLLYDRFSAKTQALVDLVGACIFLIPTCVVVIWSGWHFMLASYQLGVQPATLGEFFAMLVGQGIGEQSQDPGGLLNRWIIKGVIPLSFALLLLGSLSFMLERWNAYRAACTPKGEAQR